MFFTCRVVQFTVLYSCFTWSKMKVDTDTVMVKVATIFTRVPVNHINVCYGVVYKTFSHEEQSGWKCQYTALI